LPAACDRHEIDIAVHQVGSKRYIARNPVKPGYKKILRSPRNWRRYQFSSISFVAKSNIRDKVTARKYVRALTCGQKVRSKR
jgi:hypothetical protein